ncbi:hypothetical protein BDV41DRAFT_579931 [Aspergillus transmontanensis]|uniref:Uncharacterized protein n=1 Tax=Aspergillus transmontanensis TaxID=1034304 RepID=A0A5N6VP61_9EURO|nr:hypothetical protein BDV41DRAFT_579931 [Aspergillus transmontanensis]
MASKSRTFGFLFGRQNPELRLHQDNNSANVISKAICYVAEFMLQTRLLGQFRHIEIEPEPPNGGNENHLPGHGLAVEEYISYANTPVDSECHQSRTKAGGYGYQKGKRRDGNALEAAGHYAISYVFTVSCAGAGVRVTLAPAGGSACIAITPPVRLQQINRVLTD